MKSNYVLAGLLGAAVGATIATIYSVRRLNDRLMNRELVEVPGEIQTEMQRGIRYTLQRVR